MKDNSLILGTPLVEGGSVRPPQHAGAPGLLASRGTSPIYFTGDGHLITIAPTGAGKGRSAIIPNLLLFNGSVIVVDPKGENYRVTADARRRMGQQIVKLDPFNLIPEVASDSFNPFDILEFTGSVVNDEIRAMIEAILGEPAIFRGDHFWDEAARSLIAGLALYIATSKDAESRNLSFLRGLLYRDDVVYGIAKTLDDEAGILQEAYEEMATYLQANDRARQDILMSAQVYFRHYGSPSVRDAVNKTSFDLSQVISGAPMSIYIIVPPTKLVSHQRLIRAWVGSLLSLISSRKHIPELKTLLLLDEAAQLGYFHSLETAITLLRGYGLTTWSFWQDLSQMQQIYPTTWESILNNCSVIQLFGLKNHRVAIDLGQIMGVEPSTLRDIARDEQGIVIDGDGPLLARKLDYLQDNLFKNSFNANPLYKNVILQHDN